jgi:hypothetical protein
MGSPPQPQGEYAYAKAASVSLREGEMGVILMFFFWLFFSLLVGILARARGRSFIAWTHVRALLLAAILGGCAAQPIALKDRTGETYRVPAKTIIVEDLAIDAKIGVGDVVYVNGWAPAHGGTAPPLHAALSAKIKNALAPDGNSGTLHITVLRAGFFVEKNVADDVVLIGLFMIGRERGFKCDAELSISTETNAERITLTHEVRRAYFSDREELAQFLDECQSNLVTQLAAVAGVRELPRQDVQRVQGR